MCQPMGAAPWPHRCRPALAHHGHAATAEPGGRLCSCRRAAQAERVQVIAQAPQDGGALADKIKWQRRRAAAGACKRAPGCTLAVGLRRRIPMP